MQSSSKNRDQVIKLDKSKTMVSINLFGKKWEFDNDTIKYIGFGLAAFYVLRIIKFVIQR